MTIVPIIFGLFTAISPAAPVTWDFAAKHTAEGKVLVMLTADLEEGWHLYATTLPTDEGPLPTEFRFQESEAYTIEVPLTEPEPVEEFDPNFALIVRHHSGEPEFTMLIEPVANEPFEVKGEVEYMVCNDRTCLPPVVVPFTIEVPPIITGKE